MPLLNKKEEQVFVTEKINIEKEVAEELKEYIEFLGMDELKENEATSHVVNEALKYIFSKDKDFRKYKEGLEKNTQSTQV